MQSNEARHQQVMEAEDPPNQSLTALYSVAAVANMVGVSPDSVRRAIASEALPAYKIRRCIRISQSDLEDWLEGRRYRASASVTQSVSIPVAMSYRW